MLRRSQMHATSTKVVRKHWMRLPLFSGLLSVAHAVVFCYGDRQKAYPCLGHKRAFKTDVKNETTDELDREVRNMYTKKWILYCIVIGKRWWR